MTPVSASTSANSTIPGLSTARPIDSCDPFTTGGSEDLADKKISAPPAYNKVAARKPASGNQVVASTTAMAGPTTYDISSSTCSSDMAVCSKAGSSWMR